MTVLYQQPRAGGHYVLLAFQESLPPLPELMRVLDRLWHGKFIFQLRQHEQGKIQRPQRVEQSRHCSSRSVPASSQHGLVSRPN